MAVFSSVRKKIKSLFETKQELPKEDRAYGYGAYYPITLGQSYTVGSRFKEDDIIATIYNKIAVDAAALQIVHCMVNEDDRYEETIKSDLNYMLNTETNLDQSAPAFKVSFYYNLCDEGVIAIVPTYFDDDGNAIEMRIAKITQWYPHSVEVQVYDQDTMQLRKWRISKSKVAIVENPFAAIMSSYSSTAKRIMRKLRVLDTIDSMIGSGKLDLIIQLPYGLSSPRMQEHAARRQQEVANQLKNSEYGIAYVDATEKVIQLNRPLENNLMTQIEYLTKQLLSRLGMTEEILNGTASEDVMNNYYGRIIKPIVEVTVSEMQRKFISREDRDAGEALKFFRNPLELTSATKLAEIADKFTRNEIATSNEIRTSMGWRPSKDPKADELRNSNLNHPDEEQYANMNNPNEEESSDY